MQANRRPDTKPELALRKALHAQGLRFRKQYRIDLGGLAVRPDVVFAGARIAVFLDGCFWHSCPLHGAEPKTNGSYWTPKLRANTERDRRVDQELTRTGWTVLRIWEHEDPREAADRVAASLRGQD